MKKNFVFGIILLASITINISAVDKPEVLLDNNTVSMESLLKMGKSWFRILDTDTGRYMGYIENNHGVWDSGFEGEYQSLFIYKIDKLNNVKWDIYVQDTGYFYIEKKNYRDWIFPFCYKVVLTKEDIINAILTSKSIELLCDNKIKYPNSCQALVVTENLRIRSKPSIAGDSTVLGKYSKFTDIVLYEETPQKDKIDELEAYWYKVKLENGIEGWVFGGYVKIYFREKDKEMILKAFK